VKSAALFLQNEANLLPAEMQLTPFITKNYEENTILWKPENEPKRTQFKAKNLPVEASAKAGEPKRTQIFLCCPTINFMRK